MKIGWTLVNGINTPSSRIEGFMLHEWLLNHGVDSSILRSPDEYNPTLSENMDVSGYDWVIFQKVCMGLAVETAKRAKEQGVKTAYYLSDLVPEANQMYEVCDALIMSSNYLAKKLPTHLQSKCLLIPDAYETEKGFYKTDYSTDKVKVLWFGTLGGWEAAAKLRPIVEGMGYKYTMISATPLADKQWSLDTIWEDIKEADIVIVPSALTEYDKCKDENRIVQSMVIGVPVIASPVPAYLKVIDQFKNGIIVHTDDWVPYLTVLGKQEVRERIGKAGRESVKEKYHIDTIGNDLLKFFKEPKRVPIPTKKNNKIVLYFPIISYTTGIDKGLHRVPYGILNTAGPLRDAGFEVEICDGRVDSRDTFLEAIKSNPLFVGISSITGVQLQDATWAAQAVRELNPSIPIVFGGWHVTLLPEQSLQEPFVDIVVRGPGENTVLELARCLQTGDNLNKVSGIGFKGSDGKAILTQPSEMITDFPRIPFNLIDLGKYGPYFGYLTSHGCVWDCGFCAIAQVYKRKFYFRNIDHVIEDLKYVVDSYPRKLVNMNIDDDCFFNNKQRVIEFCDKWNNYRNVPISMLAHVRILLKYSDEMWEKLYKGGIRQILIGAESGNQVVLDRLKKYQTPEQMLEFVKKATQFGITPELSCLTGFPDSIELGDFKDTILFLKEAGKINPNIAYKMFWIRPYPGTSLFEDFKAQGYKMPSTMREWSNYTLRRTPSWVDGELEDMVKFYTYAFQPQVRWDYTWESFSQAFKQARAYGKIPNPPGL